DCNARQLRASADIYRRRQRGLPRDRRRGLPHRMNERIAVVGLGYVGLPLARALASAGLDVSGYDVDEDRAASLGRSGSAEACSLAGRSIFIICVPTPADLAGPDKRALGAAARDIAPHLSEGSIVVVESTVWVGGTE